MKLIFCDNTLWGLINFRGDVIRHLVDEGHDVVLVAPEKEDKQMRTSLPQGVRYIHVGMKRTSMNPLKDLRYFRQMYKIFRRERPDFVFTYTIKPNIYASIAAKLNHCRTTALLSGLGYIFINDSSLTRLARSLYRFGLRFTDHLLVLNEENRNIVKKRHMCSMQKVVMLMGGEGVNVEKFQRQKNASTKTTFLYIGRILWDKGYEELSQAAALVKEQYPNVSIELLGAMDPSYPKSVPESRVKADEAQGILKYIGFTRQMLDVYKRQGIVVVMPSYGEGMNRTLMEACATGKPIITTDIPGCRESVDDGVNGYIVPPRNAKALADAMMKYLSLSEENKEKMCKASREKAEKVFDIKRVIKVYDSILDGTISQNTDIEQ